MTAGTESYPLAELARRIAAAEREIPPVRMRGKVTAVHSASLAVSGLSSRVELGSLLDIEHERKVLKAEVIRVERDHLVARLFEAAGGIGIGANAFPAGELEARPHRSWMGRIIDSLGRPLDGAGSLEQGALSQPLRNRPPPSTIRQAVGGMVRTGVRAIDAFTPLCHGQRIGLFAGSGVGKSTLLAMLARSPGFDVTVVALVGERGREVREFVTHALGEAVKRAVVVVSTGDDSAMMRRQAPLLATAIAECYRDSGQSVLLLMDSVTRYAQACREVALSAGEPPVARGFPPSVFADLPALLERAGPGPEGKGSITAAYAVLVDGDDHNDPVADAIRGTLDGHIVLSREIADSGRFPAIDLLGSISRLAPRAWLPDQARAIAELRRLTNSYEETRDLRAIGGYTPGADKELDRALAIVPKLYRVLAQSPGDAPSLDAFREIAAAIADQAGG